MALQTLRILYNFFQKNQVLKFLQVGQIKKAKKRILKPKLQQDFRHIDSTFVSEVVSVWSSGTQLKDCALAHYVRLTEKDCKHLFIQRNLFIQRIFNMPTLDFKGKHHIYAHHLSVPYRPLEPDENRSCNPSGEEDNLIIHGDNLHALKALLPRYANRVKCIYIDPPYNTGNEGWVYNDNVNNPPMQEWFKEHSPVDTEDMERHDKWLCMMWPRLHLLKELLAENGAIFISIDDHEQHRLRMLMDEIFGAENFVTNIIWQKKFSPQNDAKYFSDNHDFVLCYAKNKDIWRPVLLPRTEEHNKRYSNPDSDPRGPWSSSGLDVKTYQEEYDYPITTPSGRVVNPPQSRCWRCSREKFDELVNDNRIWFGEEGNNVPRVKRFLSEVKQGITPLTVWLHEDVGHTQSATQGLNKIGVAFPNPKPHTLLKRVLQIGTQSNDIILDSFAGSGTTAHAVLALNKEDEGNRKFILVECEEYADTITAERVRRIINGVENAKDETLKEGLGGSFTYCTLGEPTEIEAMLTGRIFAGVFRTRHPPVICCCWCFCWR